LESTNQISFQEIFLRFHQGDPELEIDGLQKLMVVPQKTTSNAFK
jgi:hypothetical protein